MLSDAFAIGRSLVRPPANSSTAGMECPAFSDTSHAICFDWEIGGKGGGGGVKEGERMQEGEGEEGCRRGRRSEGGREGEEE